MKKQILILSIFVLALIAGNSTAYGQITSTPGSAPQALTGCSDDALHPIPGKEYTYQSTVASGTGNYTWWATTDPNFITTDGTGTSNNLSTAINTPNILSPSSNYGVSGTADNVQITWSTGLLANTTYNTAPTFVVVQYEDAAGCSNNLKVYQLDPQVAFTVDIRNIDVDGGTGILDYGTTAEQCIDVVRGAAFNGTAMEYDYGSNVFYYEVVAANFVTSWTPSFSFTGLNGVQAATIEYTVSAPADFATATWSAEGTAVTTTETNTSTGVSIYVRVTVTNNNYEGITDQDVTLAVSGEDSSGQLDLNNADCSTPADAAAAQADDTAVQSQNARPVLPSTTTSTTAPNTNLIPGNEANN